MSDMITLTLRVGGETTIEVDRAEYGQAKTDGEADQFLDVYLSDVDTRSTVIEPDGREYEPFTNPHGPGPVVDEPAPSGPPVPGPPVVGGGGG